MPCMLPMLDPPACPTLPARSLPARSLPACSMEFVADQVPATSALTKAYINHASAPFLPDIVAIVYQMLCLDSEERQARAKAGEGASASAAGSAAGPPLALAAPSAAAPGQG